MSFALFMQKIVSETDVKIVQDRMERYTEMYPNEWKPGGKDQGDPCLQVSWTTGGVSGGSCWDTGEGPDPHRPIDSDREPELGDLDKILMKVCPNLPFLRYKVMTECLVKNSEYTQNDFYGNYTKYGIKKILMRELYDYLKSHRLLHEDYSTSLSRFE